MRLNYLGYLLTIDKYRSISAAARELYIGQTTLSSIVKSIEKELGFTIFQRTHNGVTTTPEGEEAIALIWEIISRFEDVQKLKEAAQADIWPVNLLSSPTISSALALPLSNAFLQQIPDCNLIFHEITGSKVIPKIRQCDFNIGMTYCGEEELREALFSTAKYQIQITRLLTDRFYLVMRKDHPLASQQEVDISLFHGMHLSMLPHYKAAGRNALSFLQRLPYDNRWTVYSNVSLVKRAVVEQNTLGVLSGYVSHFDTSVPREAFHVVPIAGITANIGMPLCLLHQNNRNLCFPEKVLIKCIQDYFSSLELPSFMQYPILDSSR